MSEYNLPVASVIIKDGTKLLQESLTSLKCAHICEMTAQMLTARTQFTRDFLADRLIKVLKIAEKQQAYIVQYDKVSNALKSELLASRGEIIKLQSDLLTAKDQQVKISVTKDKQLNDLKNSVVESVGKTVKTEMKSYSEALGSSENHGAMDCNMIKKVFQEVVAEEDRSKNFMIFGLEEKKNETLPEIVSEVLLELGERPKFGASRLGLQSVAQKKKVVRPVKVTVSDSNIVQQILRKSRHLRKKDQYKTVFISPDRSADERAEHKRLVLELKEKVKQEPDKVHFIHGGQLHSRDKKTDQ